VDKSFVFNSGHLFGFWHVECFYLHQLTCGAGGSPVPYLRLYARDLQTEQKRVIAEKLIEITLRTFQLHADQRYQTSIQFITQPQVSGADGRQAAVPHDGDFTLEVIGHNLTEEKKRAFAKEAAAMFTHFAPMKPRNRIARLLGIKAKSPQQICLQFNELSPAISDPIVVDSQQSDNRLRYRHHVPLVITGPGVPRAF
jgi:hypothetical protein